MASTKLADTLSTDPKVVIVGGGVSGLAAATRLLNYGFKKVKILEAEDRLGGRVHTVPFGERYVDLGAHWIHGEDGNAVFKIASEKNLTYHSGDFEKIEFYTEEEQYEGGNETFQNFWVALDDALEDTEALSKFQGNLYDFISSESFRQRMDDSRYTKTFIEWISKFRCTIEGCDDLKDVSPQGLEHYQICSGDSLTTWKNAGYYSIVDLLLNRHPSSIGVPVDVQNLVSLKCKVNLIEWNGKEAVIKCANGSVHQADHVIVTVSLGVLKEKYSSLFNPPLPDSKVKAIKGLGIGTVDKIYLHFSERWWPEDIDGFSFLRTSDQRNGEEYGWEKEVLGFYRESSAPNVLGGWLQGDGAKEMELYTEEQILQGCYRVLKKFLGKHYTIPRPTSVIRSKWWTNPHFRGSYTYRSMDSDRMNVSAKDLAKPIVNFYNKEILLFAGEATHSSYYSTVHGALETGWREADRLAQKYAKGRLCSL